MAAPTRSMTFKERRELAKKIKDDAKRKKRDEKEKLIREIEMRPAIWDRSLPREKDVVADMWSEVASCMGKDKTTCKKMWKGLLDHFRTLMSLVYVNKDSGDGADENTIVSWPFFQRMHFMKDTLMRRTTISNDTEVIEVFPPVDNLDDTNDANGNELVAESTSIPLTTQTSAMITDFNVTIPNPSSMPSTSIVSCGNAGAPPPPPKRKKAMEDAIDSRFLYQMENVDSDSQKCDEKPETLALYISDVMKRLPPPKRRQFEAALLAIVSRFVNPSDEDE